MKLRACLPLILLVCAAAAPADDHGRSWSISERPDGSRLVNGRWLRPAWTARWNELVGLALQDGQLLPSRAAVDGLRARLRGRQNVLVRIESSPDLWLITAGANADGATLQCLAVRDKRDLPAEWYRPTGLTIAGDVIEIGGEGVSHLEPITTTFRSRPREPDVQLLVNGLEDQHAVVRLDLRAGSLTELVAQHPVESRQYLLPLLRAVAGPRFFAPGAGDVYRAFTDIPADDPAAKTQAMAEVARLADASAARRNDAEARLEALGPPAVLVLLRLDVEMLARLTPEQQQRIENVVARSSPRGGDAAQLARDPWFLFDCLSDPDPRVRQRARSALAVMVGHDIEINAEVDPAKQLPAMSKLAEDVDRVARAAPAPAPAPAP